MNEFEAMNTTSIDSISKEPWACLNGSWMRDSEAVIPVENRGMMYGDGLFETMVSTDGQVKLLDLHLKRLVRGLEYLGIDLKTSTEEWGAFFEEGINKNSHLGTQLLLRLQCWRNGGRGYTSKTSEGSWFLSFRTMSKECNQPSYRLMSSSLSLPVKSVQQGTLKSSNALLYVLAATEAKNKNFDDALLCNTNGYVGECTSANIFWIKERVIHTPSIKCGILKGTRREALLHALQSQSYFRVQEGTYDIHSLYEADMVFSTSTIKGIQSIDSLDTTQFSKDEHALNRIKKFYQSIIL